MKVLTDVHGNYVIRHGNGFTITSRRGELELSEALLTSPQQVEEFTEALAAAARDAARLQGKPKYRPSKVRKPQGGWPIAMETK